jgi:5-deoxy-glucuronate isomerase
MFEKTNTLLVKQSSHNVYQRLTSEQAGWKYLNFQASMMQQGETLSSDTGKNECLFVLLGGNFSIYTTNGRWETQNGRKDVFSGLPHAVYLPPNTKYTLKAESDILDIASGWCPCDEDYGIQYITPEDVHNHGIELRGGDNASRQINSILPPGSKCQRLVCVEVYTPSGNWSSFPAHKHDERKLDPKTGEVIEASLEEVYFYKMEKPQGFAVQKIYTDDRSLDEIVEANHNDLVKIPRGYHPVIAGHGYHVYYLNFLAGSDQSLANTDDSAHKWIYGTWKGMDTRLPLVDLKMNKKIAQ